MYVGCDDGKMYALNPANGAIKWEFVTGTIIASSPAIGADGTIYFGADDFKLHAVADLGNRGVERWAFPTGDWIVSSPAIGPDGTIYFGSYDRNLYAVTPAGVEKWRFPTGGAIYSSPAIAADGTVYVGSFDQRLYAVAPDGAKKWDFFTNGEIWASVALGADGTVYFPSLDLNFYALNPEGSDTQRVKWSKPIGAASHSTASVRGDADLAGRVMLCHRAEMLPVECIVRGYITGSAWKEYKKGGTMHGAALPGGLLESSQLPAPVFTPSTKAAVGDHDENISFDAAADLVGRDLAKTLRDVSLALYSRGAAWAAERGIIIADTKFELGRIPGTGELVLCDEVLTPDSSRFWPVAQWKPGSTPPSFDKQPVRDYLETLDWDKTPPPPSLPKAVVDATSTRYVEAYERITGRTFADWPGVR